MHIHIYIKWLIFYYNKSEYLSHGYYSTKKLGRAMCLSNRESDT